MQPQAEVKAYSETLEQDVSTTISRDLKNICTKLRYVIIPKFNLENDPQATKQLRNWDLWGPLFLCLILSLYLSSKKSVLNLGIKTDGKSFGIIFLVMWGGSFVVTINTKLLGGHISFFQCVCVLGYCILPIVLAAVGVFFLKQVSLNIFIIKVVIAIVALIWSTLSSISFMNVLIDDSKNIIAVYPVFLFYLFIDWFVIFI